MKISAITRIILFSIVIVLLLGILLAGLGLGVFSFITDTGSDSYQVSSVPVVCLDPATVGQVEIEWVAGTVRVVAADVEEITFSESGYDNDSQKMVWKQTGDTLSIQFQKPALRIGFFSDGSKDLLISVPRDWSCRELSIETVSGGVELENLTVQETDLDGVSAKWDMTDCQMGDLDISTVSGDVFLQGSLDTFSCDGVSARCELFLQAQARQIELDCASGDLFLNIPEDFGFTAELDSASGDLHTTLETRRENGRYVHGDGSCQIDVDTASGDLHIAPLP